MVKLKVLQLTDVEGSDDAYSEQLNALLGSNRHISETDYFWTRKNFIVDIEQDINEELPNIKQAIKLGAKVTNMYFVEDSNFSENMYEFEAKGIWAGVEYGEDHGVIFKLKRDAERFEKMIGSLVDEADESEDDEKF